MKELSMNPLLKMKKQDYILLIFAISLVTVILIIATIATSKPQNSNTNTSNITSKIIAPTIATNNTIVKYDANKQDSVYKKIQNRPSLKRSDDEVKRTIITSLGNKTGMLYESQNVAVSYIMSGDLFQAEILTTDIQTAKQEATQWFTSQGLSHQGMCDLPVIFFLNSKIARDLHASDNQTIFNPLPQGCE